MAVQYQFIDGSTQDCFLPSDTPVSWLDGVIGQYGIIAVEVLSVPPYKG